MRKFLLFLVYAIVIFALLAGFTSLVWLPLFFLQTKCGFVIGAFVTATTIAITKLVVDDN